MTPVRAPLADAALTRLTDLEPELLDPARLLSAFGHVAAAGGAPGVDGVSLDQYGANVDERLSALADDVRAGRYRPAGLLAVRIPKDRDPRGRELLIPTVADRVLMRAAHDLLAPAVDARLLPCAHGYRPGRSVRSAIRKTQTAIERRPWVADADIRDFFASAPHRVVLEALSTVVGDDRVLVLVERWLAAPALRAGSLVARDAGLPLGSPLSPLLANLVLHPLDMGLWRPDTTYVRFADDLVACCPDEAVARQQLEACAAILADLGLRLNEEKSRVLDSRRESFVFLGHLLRARPGGEQRQRELPRKRTLHLVEPGSRLTARGQRLILQRDGVEMLTVPVRRVREIVVLAPVDIASAAMTLCLGNGVDVSWLSDHGRWWGSLRTWRSESPGVLRDQVLATLDMDRCLALGRTMIAAKLANQKRLLQRHHSRGQADLSAVLRDFRQAERALGQARTRSAIMGAEGLASRAFFAGVATIVDPKLGFGGRVRRPPRDPVNAMLSFGYVLLTNEVATVCQQVGLDASFGVLHQLRAGRPSLALDLVEELRPVVVDSLVLATVGRHILRTEHFVSDPATGGTRLRDEARKVFLREYELRMLTLFAHEASGERVSYRRALTLQAQQLVRALRHPEVPYLPIRLK